MATADLLRRIARFRWGAYAGFALIPLTLAWYTAWQTGPLVLAAALLTLPLIYGSLERRIAGVERLENLLTPLLAAAAGLPLLPGLTLLAALFAGTLARCGLNALLPGLLCLGCGWFAGRGLALSPVLDARLEADVLAVLFLIAFSAPLAALGYEETLRQYRRRKRVQTESHQLARHTALLEQFLPPDLDRRLHALDGSAHDIVPQRRWLTVAAVDLADFTTLLERLAPEDVLTVLDDLYAYLATLCRRHGGALHKFVGDGAIACFGALDPVERRAAAAQCCAMLDELPSGMAELNATWRTAGIPVTLTVRAGAASGYCAIGAIGRGQRRDFTVIGSAVNLAHRLQAVAPLGRAVVDGATADLLDVAARERVVVRGFATPVRIHALGGEPKLTRA